MDNRIITILKKHNIDSLFFIDVGAKDKLDFLEDLSTITNIVGFEPNPIELEILKEKYIQHNFKSLALIGNCLSDYEGEVSFNVTKHSSMSSLLETDLGNYQKHFGLYKNFDNWKSNIAIENVIKTSAVTLDNFIKDKNETIDYLKIDTQGSELKILHGAAKLLNEKRINILKVEVSTIAVYQNQVLFSDIDIYLRDKGYVLVDFITYRENYTPVLANSHDKNCHYAPCGDAIYVLDSEFLSNENKIKSGFLLLWLGYYSLGSYLLNTSGLSIEEQKVFTNHNFISFRKKIKQLIINLCPPMVLQWFKKR
ncbi:FkbM family methyltransferase [Flavobacterium sp. AS60]|uniref:FkbM family methyltransferase n=1 Tax=Flavobacterium anseongense TaxID=2910677 RepID=UPI001F3B734F|nr:FkbM family methyltransferase [Flavobacterium sp. AS60]MCF6128466.1 FkbM family methyltransferase [Flavobacterium sp. AS60]